ncbi:MAG: peroxidase [Rhodospirillales bacterium]|jgi:uncharacterized peroxidase-related enzyme|nr:peroxidase [Rhodospirillales bacterium]MBT5075088.1 peroxidase [Rhodospirillales bacterium]MBT5112655.1 peroxidase [Rhodospirillales bacterium]MBT5673424.1 peroxidase [Rhodospirillales bacterium]MBT6186083.1 peroxidase [Rhodospirillales bacterium]
MPFFKSLSENANVGEVFGLKPDARRAQGEMGRIIMRGDSPLSAAERETIAAYVSHLNKCEYCYGGHSEVAKKLGADDALFDNFCDDAESLLVDDKFKAILRFTKILTLTPNQITDGDAQAVFDAGWEEQALHDAILVICRFSFMNRLTLGHGLNPDPEKFKDRAAGMAYNSERHGAPEEPKS